MHKLLYQMDVAIDVDSGGCLASCRDRFELISLN